MKYNNIETLATALEKAVNELVEVKAQLSQARADRNTFREAYLTQVARAKEAEGKLAEARAEMFDTQEELTVSEMDISKWKVCAEEAEEKLARLEKCRERDLDDLIYQFGYYKWEAYNSELVDKIEANGAAKGIRYAIGLMYQVGVNAFFDTEVKGHMVIEVWNCNGDKPAAYYHWYEKYPMTKVEVK